MTNNMSNNIKSNSFKLYNYFRSSASYRVRIALHFKGIPFEYIPVHLVKDGGEQFLDNYKKLNPISQVPCLVHGDKTISQSVAIIEYLDEVVPTSPLYPKDAYQRALVRQICEIFNSSIQPLQNLIVLAELTNSFKANDAAKTAWIQRWNHNGLQAVESLIKTHASANNNNNDSSLIKYCFGDSFTAADCFLAPQIFSALRFGRFIFVPYNS
ncbi:MAG: maleylacetoacetate isomerase [Bdellovibrionales bacterium]